MLVNRSWGKRKLSSSFSSNIHICCLFYVFNLVLHGSRCSILFSIKIDEGQYRFRYGHKWDQFSQRIPTSVFRKKKKTMSVMRERKSNFFSSIFLTFESSFKYSIYFSFSILSNVTSIKDSFCIQESSFISTLATYVRKTIKSHIKLSECR